MRVTARGQGSIRLSIIVDTPAGLGTQRPMNLRLGFDLRWGESLPVFMYFVIRAEFIMRNNGAPFNVHSPIPGNAARF